MPPNDEEAEEAVLGSLLLDPPRLEKVVRLLAADDFYCTKNRLVYDAMLRLRARGEPPDVILVARELEARHELADAGGRERLDLLGGCAPTPTVVDHYAQLVRLASKKRAYLRFASHLQQAAYNGTPEADLDSAAGSGMREVAELFPAPAAAPGDECGIHVVQKGAQAGADWVVRGIVARRAVTLLTSLPKVGKTTFVYAMVAAALRGDPAFVDCAIPSPMRRAIVLSEEDDDVLFDTYSLVGLDAACAPAITRRGAYPRRPLEHVVDQVLADIRRKPDVDLVVVDHWRFWSNLPTKAQNDSGAVIGAFQHLKRLAAAGVAVLLLHHHRKSAGDEGTQIADSIALLGEVDVSLEMRRFGKEKKGTARQLEGSGRLQRILQEAVVDFRDGRYAYAGDFQVARDHLEQERVRKALADAGKWLTTEGVELAAGGMKDSACRAALRALHARGEIQRAGSGARGSPQLFAALNVPLHAQPTGGVP